MANTSAVADSNARGWVRQPYGCSIKQTYKDYRDQLLEILLASKVGEDGKDAVNMSAGAKDTETLSESDGGETAALIKQIGALKDQVQEKMDFSDTNIGAHLVDLPSISDSSIFGNEVINPYSGFCRDDDIVPEAYKSVVGPHTYQMGRVYREIYDTKQQVVFMQFGIPKYRNLFHFLLNASNSSMSEMNDYGDSSIIADIANFFIDTTKLAINIVTSPIEWSYKFFYNLDKVKISEYFYFKESMFMYWNYVNTILIHLASDIGLWNNSSEAAINQQTKLPAILKGDKNSGPDIYSILSCRGAKYKAKTLSNSSVAEQYKAAGAAIGNRATLANNILSDPEKADAGLVPSTDNGSSTTEEDRSKGFYDKIGSLLESGSAKLKDLASRAYNGFWSQTFSEMRSTLVSMWNGYEASAYDSTKWLAFRLEKDSDNSNESFSNSLSVSSLQEELNGFAATNRQVNLEAGVQGGGWLGGINRYIKKAMTVGNTIMDIVSKDKGAGAISSLIAYINSGNGYYDLPQQWSGSSFSRSVSINVRLRSRTGGDPVSIYTNVLIPFACILAGACPRANGDSTYTSPFIMRAYCRGMFAISAGMITSLSINRGDSEFGWSIHRLPTTMSIQIQITDLSPILFLSLSGADAGFLSLGPLFMQAFANNTKMHDYLATVSGMGLKQRIYWGMSTKRNLKLAGRIAASHWCNPTYYGMLFADTWVSRSVMAFRKAGNMNVPNN